MMVLNIVACRNFYLAPITKDYCKSAKEHGYISSNISKTLSSRGKLT